jgi:hypothetical protein
MMLRVSGRLLAACGWLAWQIERRLGPLRRLGGRRIVAVLAGALAVGAVAVVAIGVAQDQPQEVTVEDIRTDAVTHPTRWVRLRGHTVPLAADPTTVGEPNANYGVLVDAENTLRAVVIQSDRPVPDANFDAEPTVFTGHLFATTVREQEVQDELPIKATAFGTPPRIATDAIAVLDPTPFPERVIWWPLTVLLALLAGILALGAWAGYPVFRPTRELDVLARPLGPGERIPAAVGGRLGEHRIDLADPAEALLLAGRGTHGPVLTIQLMPAGGPAPRPVSIGDGWTKARIGYLHVLGETVPALKVRAERANITLLFARRSERDRAASMVATDR